MPTRCGSGPLLGLAVSAALLVAGQGSPVRAEIPSRAPIGSPASARALSGSTPGSGQDGHASFGPAARLHGTITGGGRRQRHVEVDVYDDQDRDGQWTVTATTTTDRSGRYVVGGLLPGTYRVQFAPASTAFVSEWYRNASSAGSADGVRVASGQSVRADARLVVAGDVTGTVHGPNAYPIANIEVTAWRSSSGTWLQAAQGRTDAQGNYDIGGLSTGSYRIGFRSPSGAWAPAFYDTSGEIGSADPVAVAAGATTHGIDQYLSWPSFVRGRLTLPSGQAAASADVTVYRWQNGSFEWFASGATGVDGTYAVYGLRAGTYRVAFYDWGAQAGAYWNGRGSLATADDIVLAELSGRYDVDAVLDPAPNPLAAVSTTPPAVVGTPRVGAVLTAMPGTWSPSTVALSYQWRVGGVTVPGATGVSYTPGPRDVGKTVQVLVAASQPGWWTGFAQSGGSLPVSPAAVPGRVTSLRLPVITGTPQVGHTIRLTAGEWQPGTVYLRVRWFADGKRIAHASGRRLPVTSALLGTRLSASVTASRAGYQSLVVRTATTRKVRG